MNRRRAPRASTRTLSAFALCAIFLACDGGSRSVVAAPDPFPAPARPTPPSPSHGQPDGGAHAFDAAPPIPPPRPHGHSAVPCDPLDTTPDTRSPQPDADARFLPVVIDVDRQMDTVHAAEIGDVNGDGFGDLVVVGESLTEDGYGWEGRLFVYLQNACNTLNKPIVRTIDRRWGTPGGMVVADVTGDGRTDVVLGNGQPLVYAQLPDGTLPEAASRVGIALPSGEAGDVTAFRDEDGTSLVFLDGPDVIVARRDAATGQFREHARRTGAGYPAILSGDVTGDGRDDLLVLDRLRAAGIVQVFAATGDDAFADPVDHYAQTSYGMAFAVGDVTGDGLADVVLSNGTNDPDSAIVAFLQKGTTLAEPLRFASMDVPGKLRLIDVDDDGRADVVVDHGRAFGVYLQDGAGSLRPEATYSCPGFNADMAVGDIDGDGLADVVRAGYRGIAVHRNSGHR